MVKMKRGKKKKKKAGENGKKVEVMPMVAVVVTRWNHLRMKKR